MDRTSHLFHSAPKVLPSTWIARGIGLIFAIIGVLPILLLVLLGNAWLRDQAQVKSAELIHDLLNLDASFEAKIEWFPFRVVCEHLRVDSIDGGKPALEIEKVSLRPRLFTLMSGKIDVGDIELENPRHRIVLRDGEIQNIQLKLPKSEGGGPTLKRLPFNSLSITGAEFDLDIEGTLIDAGPLDIDIFSANVMGGDVAVRLGYSTITRRGHRLDDPFVDEDAICQLDLRASIDEGALQIRRMNFDARVDLNPDEGTRPSCDSNTPENQLSLQASQTVLRFPTETTKLSAAGFIAAHVPLDIVNRFAPKVDLHGWAALEGEGEWSQEAPLKPRFDGQLNFGEVRMQKYRFVEYGSGKLQIVGGSVSVPLLNVGYAGGKIEMRDIIAHPFDKGAPFRVKSMDARDVEFPYIMRDCGVTPNTIVSWHLDRTLVKDFGGTIFPVAMDGTLFGDSSNFEITIGAFHDPNRKHVIGVKKAKLTGRVQVRNDYLGFLDTVATFGESRLLTSVKIGFSNSLWLDLKDGSALDLKDISPLLTIPMAGKAKLTGVMEGPGSDPELKAHFEVKDFEFATFPIGDIETDELYFKPLFVEFGHAKGRKGKTQFNFDSARLDFEDSTGANVAADAKFSSPDFHIQDFIEMFHFEDDPRWQGISGHGPAHATLRYQLGGVEDRCDMGALRVTGAATFKEFTAFEEQFEEASSPFDFLWDDINASYQGMKIDINELAMQKGNGWMLGKAKIDYGGKFNAHMVATGIPLSSIQSLGAAGELAIGHVDASADIFGTIDEMSADVRIRMSPIRVGRASFPASRLHTTLTPRTAPPPHANGLTQCGRPFITPDPNPPKERVVGVYRTDGDLFDQQISLEKLEYTREVAPKFSGKVHFKKLDLGAFSEISNTLSNSKSKREGSLTGFIDVKNFDKLNPAATDVKVRIAEAHYSLDGNRFELKKAAEMDILKNQLDLKPLSLIWDFGGQAKGEAALSGYVRDLTGRKDVQFQLDVPPIQLAPLARLNNNIDSIDGTGEAHLAITGTADKPELRGEVNVQAQTISIRNVPVPMTELQLQFAIGDGKIRVAHGQARLGGGIVNLDGQVDLDGLSPTRLDAHLGAKAVSMQFANGLSTSLGADISIGWNGKQTKRGPSVEIGGSVDIDDFLYSKAISLEADLSSVGNTAKQTNYDAYDPSREYVALDIAIHANHGLRIENNLLETALDLDRSGLRIVGTNQRMGALGVLKVRQGGRITLRNNVFEVRNGDIRFTDQYKLNPMVDVTAVTDYRRNFDGASTSNTYNEVKGSTVSNGGNAWQISLHAYGPAEDLKIDMTSRPELAEEDIFLLLAIGLTRAEMEQMRSANVGSSVAFEALGALSGASSAVTEAVPLIDDFQFGSQYSSKTGRTEPTITIGKRLNDKLRAYVTASVSDANEIKAKMEWRLTDTTSFESSYDNFNVVSNSVVGNVGGDIRWRVEFE